MKLNDMTIADIEQSAYQGFVAGAEFVRRKIYERLSEVLEDKKEERV
jgi:hypothetical protein